jgi:hypothetical protein
MHWIMSLTHQNYSPCFVKVGMHKLHSTFEKHLKITFVLHVEAWNGLNVSLLLFSLLYIAYILLQCSSGSIL